MTQEKSKSTLEIFCENPQKLAMQARKVLQYESGAASFFEQSVGQFIHFIQKRINGIETFNESKKALSEKANSATTLEELDTHIEEFCKSTRMVEHKKYRGKAIKKLVLEDVLQIEIEGRLIKILFDPLYLTIFEYNNETGLWAIRNHYYEDSNADKTKDD